MDFLKPIKELFDGTCFNKFDCMSKDKKIETVIKTAAVALAAGILIGILNPIAAIIIVPVVSIYAFAYFTSTYEPLEFVSDHVGKVKDEGIKVWNLLKNKFQ